MRLQTRVGRPLAWQDCEVSRACRHSRVPLCGSLDGCGMQGKPSLTRLAAHDFRDSRVSPGYKAQPSADQHGKEDHRDLMERRASPKSPSHPGLGSEQDTCSQLGLRGIPQVRAAFSILGSKQQHGAQTWTQDTMFSKWIAIFF